MYANFKKENEASETQYTDFIMKLFIHYKLNSLWQAASCVNKQLLLSKNVNHIVDSAFKAFMKKLNNSPNNIFRNQALSLSKMFRG